MRAHAAASLEAFSAHSFGAVVARDLAAIAERDRASAVRWHAMWALFRGYARLADPALLRRGLHDPDELYRIETVRAWNRRGAPPLAEMRRLATSDPSWRVRFEARETLRRARGLPATEHLTAMPPHMNLPPLGPAGSGGALAPAGPSGNEAKLAPPRLETLSTALPFPRTAAEMDAPAPGPHPRVLLRTTRGDVVLRLYPEWAPETVANFTALARRGYFDRNRWFRIVPDFVDQTGDPHDDGNGDAGYAIGAELNPIEQRAFVVAMGLDYAGKRAKRDSAGTQFYVTLSPQLHLDRDFSVFGEVERGADVLANLVERDRILVARPIAPD